MLKGLLMSVGYILLRLIYGKAEFEKRKFRMIHGVGLSMAFALWILTLLGSFTENNERIFCIIYTILFPTVIVVWTILARRKLKRSKNDGINHTDEIEHHSGEETNDHLTQNSTDITVKENECEHQNAKQRNKNLKIKKVLAVIVSSLIILALILNIFAVSLYIYDRGINKTQNAENHVNSNSYKNDDIHNTETMDTSSTEPNNTNERNLQINERLCDIETRANEMFDSTQSALELAHLMENVWYNTEHDIIDENTKCYTHPNTVLNSSYKVSFDFFDTSSDIQNLRHALEWEKDWIILQHYQLEKNYDTFVSLFYNKRYIDDVLEDIYNTCIDIVHMAEEGGQETFTDYNAFSTKLFMHEQNLNSYMEDIKELIGLYREKYPI